MQEDEQLFLDDTQSAMEQEQLELMPKVNKFNPFVKVLGAASGIMFLVLGNVYIPGAQQYRSVEKRIACPTRSVPKEYWKRSCVRARLRIRREADSCPALFLNPLLQPSLV